MADRMRAERETERFSQYELAEQLGVTRSVLSNFEQHQAPLSFAVGFEFCRRLDLSPRWLATGEEPKRPFVAIDELGISATELRQYSRRGVDFLNAYERLLRRPLEVWLKQNPPEKLVARMMRGGLEPLIKRWSNRELITQLQGRVADLRSADAAMRKANADAAEILIGEIGARLAVLRGQMR